MKWLDALKQATKSIGRLDNRQAAGLINFARRTVIAFQKTHDVPKFDWYTLALPALGWWKQGDKFRIDTAWQLQKLPEADENNIAAALSALAAALDGQNVPFRAVVDPRGTDAIFRKLAKDAWAVMQEQRKAGIPDGQIRIDPIEQAPASTAPEQLPLPNVEASPPAAPSSATSTPTTPRAMARAALAKYVEGPDHKRYFMWTINGEGASASWWASEHDDKATIEQLFTKTTKEVAPTYSAWWDTTRRPFKPISEYAGALEVKPDKDAKKGGGGGAIALLVLLLASGKRKRGRR